MLQQIGLLVVVLATSAWGRGEFRLGGADGNSWQALVAEQTAAYVLLDAEGGIVEEVTIGAVDEEVSVRFNTAGVDTLIDFAEGGPAPGVHRPEPTIWRCRSRNAEGTFTRPAFTAVRTW